MGTTVDTCAWKSESFELGWRILAFYSEPLWACNYGMPRPIYGALRGNGVEKTPRNTARPPITRAHKIASGDAIGDFQSILLTELKSSVIKSLFRTI